MIKQILKKSLKWINDESIITFCKIHFRQQVRRYCKKNNIDPIDKQYEKDVKAYWNSFNQPISMEFHRWYAGCNGIKDVRYIPDDFFFYAIEQYYNDMSLEKAYCDKAMYRKNFPNLKQPDTVIVNINGQFYDKRYRLIDTGNAIKRIMDEPKVVIKPTIDTGGGKNVRFLTVNRCTATSLYSVLKKYEKNFIVQKPLIQHANLEKIHKNSINTIRVMSMFENGEVKIISTILRMGIGDAQVDNECSGGINCGVNDDGTLSHVAYDRSGKCYPKHPDGFEFKTGKIPSYDKIKKIIIEQHKKMPYFGLISWDYTVDERGEPVMVELNLSWCGLSFHQLHHGPLFGNMTDRILNDVCKGKHR